MLERALVIDERAYGPDHTAVSVTLTGLGLAYATLGEVELAQAAVARIVRFTDFARVSTNAIVAELLLWVALIQQTLGNADAALCMWGEARSELRGVLGLAGRHHCR